MKRVALVLVLAASGCGSEPEAPKETTVIEFSKLESESETPEDGDNPCKRLGFEDVLLTHCIADPDEHRIATVLGPKPDMPYRGLGGLAEDRAKESADVAFAINGGMFDEEGQPIGYYVEDGKRLKTINTNEGPGNFHMLPNGVFFGTGGKWQVHTSANFIENITKRPAFGTQSGPMLLIDGKLHPKIAEDGDSRHIRNAVGVDEDGRAHFVISEVPVSFGKLARFFRDELELDEALYLDGKVSALWNPATARIDARAPLGPLIVVEKRSKAGTKALSDKADTADDPETDEEEAENGQ